MSDSSGIGRTFGESATVQITGKIMVIAIIILFVVVVLVLFLHLYAKWFWWHVEEAPSPPYQGRGRRRRRRFVFAPGQDPTFAVRRGLDPSVLRSLPVVVFRPEEFKDGLECAVCLSEVVEGEKARLLPKCNHGFHVDCIDMWFQSHSTCPLCRNAVAPESTHSTLNDESTEDVQSPQENLASAYSTETPNFPTNVLFWGNQTQVSTGGACLEEGASSQAPCSTSPSSSSSSPSGSSNRQDGMLVIDIPVQMSENLSSSSPTRFAEDECKSPMPTRLRSLKRLLSREKRVAPSASSSNVDV